MAKEICISSTPHETRLAILEDDQLAEIYYERENEYTLAGSIYNGRVTRVLPGMQSAFVDIGLERDAFLYVTDFLELEDQEETDELEKAAASGGNQPPREVRHTGERGPARPDAAKTRESQPKARAQAGAAPGPRPDGTSPPQPKSRRIERGTRDQRPTPVPEPSAATSASRKTRREPARKRWRGRRRRRGGRGAGRLAESQPETGEPRRKLRPQSPAEPELRRDSGRGQRPATPRSMPSLRAPAALRTQPSSLCAARRVAFKVWRRTGRERPSLPSLPLPARPASYLQAVDADRSSPRVGRQRPAARRVALQPSRPPTEPKPWSRAAGASPSARMR